MSILVQHCMHAMCNVHESSELSPEPVACRATLRLQPLTCMRSDSSYVSPTFWTHVWCSALAQQGSDRRASISLWCFHVCQMRIHAAAERSRAAQQKSESKELNAKWRSCIRKGPIMPGVPFSFCRASISDGCRCHLQWIRMPFEVKYQTESINSPPSSSPAALFLFFNMMDVCSCSYHHGGQLKVAVIRIGQTMTSGNCKWGMSQQSFNEN